MLSLLALFPMGVSAQDGIASSGEDFYLALPWLIDASPALFRVSIAATRPCEVTVRFTETERDTTKTLLAGERWDLEIPREQIVLDPIESITRRSLHVTSTGPVTVNAAYDVRYVSDAFCVLPSQLLGFDYLAMVHPTDSTHEGLIAVVATADQTTIRITPTAQTTGSVPGATYARTLQSGEVYQILASSPRNTDLTGTRIRSDKPVVVISGHRGATIGPIDALNSLLEQMVPIVDWGSTFYSTPLPGNDTGYYRVLASREGTEVFGNGRRIATLAAGESRRFTAEGSVKIEATAPVALAQYTIRFVAPRREPNSDPSMMMVNPVASYGTSFLWGTPALRARLDQGDTTGALVDFHHYVQITAPVAALGSVRLDGAPVAFNVLQPDGAYSSAIVRVGPGAHRLTASAPVNAQIFGYSHFDAYSLPAGMRLRDPFRGEPLFVRTCAGSIDTTVTLTNVGIEQIDIVSIELSPEIQGAILSPAFYPFPLLPNTSVMIRVRLDLSSFGMRSGSIIVHTATSGGRPLSIPVEISRDSLAIDFLESLIRFPDVNEQSPGADTVVRIVNTGTGPTTISSTTFSGPFQLISPALPVTLAAGDTLTLRIRFLPPAAGAFDGRIVAFQRRCGIPDTLALSGYRLRPAAVVAEAGAGGSLLCSGDELDIPLTISNPGEEPLRLDSLELRGIAPGDYTIIDSHRGLLIPAGGSLVVRLRFAPTRTGDRPAEIRVWNNRSPGGYLLTSISARKDSIGLAASPGRLDFGATTGCEQVPSLQFELLNSGTLPVTIDSIRFSRGDFRLDGAVPLSIAAGGTTPISIIFDPRGSGPRFDTLRIYGDRCALVAEITLQGEQRGASLSATADTIDFGLVAPCALPLTRTLRLVNTGTITERIGRLEVDAPGFTLSLPDSVLAPGEEVSVEIEFSGDGENLYETVLTVFAEPCSLERKIYLRARRGSVRLLPVEDIDLGLLTPGQPRRAGTTLVNDGSIPLTIDSISLLPSGAALTVISPSFPFVIAPGETRDLEIEYSALDGGQVDLQATLFAGAPCAFTSSFAIIGRQQKEGELLVLRLPDTSASVDERLAIPIEIIASREFDADVTIDATIAWEQTALSGADISTPIVGGTIERTTDTIFGGYRHVGFRYRGPVPLRGVIAYLSVLTLLGTTDTTSLRVVEVLAVSGNPRGSLPIRSENGGVRTLGICRIGGDRFIRLGASASMAKISPNPMRDAATVEIVLPSAAPVTLRIHDGLGRAWVLFSGDLPAGMHTIPVQRHYLPSGFYQLELESSGRRTYRELILIR